MKLPESVRLAGTISLRIAILVLSLIGLNDVLNWVGHRFGIGFYPIHPAAVLVIVVVLLILAYRRSFRWPFD
jgi:hypothetical protein